MKTLSGQSRVIIEGVYPEIDGGQTPIKRVVDQTLNVEVDIYSDGHDIVAGQILFRHEKQKKWQESYLTPLVNDRWEGSFTVTKQGWYEYTFVGWVDQALTWKHEIEKKIQAGVKVDVELNDGVRLLKRIRSKATKEEKAYLDKLIKSFPNPKQYRSATTECLGHDLEQLFIKYPTKDYHTVYCKSLSVYVDRKKALYSSWYEFFPRSAGSKEGQHGTLKDCLDQLPRIAGLGFDTIYFPPIHPIGRSYRKGKNNSTNAEKGEPGSPWAIGASEGGHKDVLPELGTLADFKAVVKECRKYKMEIAMDIALQCAPDHPYVKEHPEWFKWRSDGTVQYAENPPKKYQDILPIHFETEDWENLWNELLSIFTFWIDQGVKVFRVDNPHTKPFGFWNWLINSVKANHPDVIFLAEAFTRPKVMQQLAKGGFTQSYTYYTWRVSKAELTEYLTEFSNSEIGEYMRPNFWPNTPDINPYHLQSGTESVFLIRFFMAATMSSNYGIYGPVFDQMIHAAVPGKEEYYDSEKYEFRQWDWSVTNKLIRIMPLVNKARKENAALQLTNNIKFCQIDNEQIIAYFKMSEDGMNKMLMVVNLDPHSKQSGWVQLPLDDIGKEDGKDIVVKDLISEASYIWNQEWNYVELDPNGLPFHLFKITN